MKNLRKILTLLFVLGISSMSFAQQQNDLPQFKQFLENRLTIVKSEISTLTVKKKINPNDTLIINELAIKQTDMKALKKKIEIVKETISVQKETAKACKVYQELVAKEEKLETAVEGIKIDENY